MKEKVFKKYLLLILFVCLAGCSKNSKNTRNHAKKSVADLQENESAFALDIDLTKMSATMIYSQIFNMIIEPEVFEGNIIKVAGKFTEISDSETSQISYAVLIPDATACCQQGLELRWEGRSELSGECPELDSEIVVTGKYTVMYDENDIMHTYIDVMELLPF